MENAKVMYGYLLMILFIDQQAQSKTFIVGTKSKMQGIIFHFIVSAGKFL
jgi:hypothetical protein